MFRGQGLFLLKYQLGWPLKPTEKSEKYSYIGSSIEGIMENIEYPRALPSQYITRFKCLKQSLPTVTLTSRASQRNGGTWA